MLRIHRNWRGKKLSSLCVTLCMALFIIALAACGNNSTTVGSPSTSTPTPTPTHPLTVEKCGSVHTIHLLVVPPDQGRAKQVEDCFWHDYQQCHPATLIYTQTSVDTGTIQNFALQNVNGKCLISDGVQHFIAPRPPATPTTYTCGSMTQQSDGLHIYSCGTIGDVFIPVVGTQ